MHMLHESRRFRKLVLYTAVVLVTIVDRVDAATVRNHDNDPADSSNKAGRSPIDDHYCAMGQHVHDNGGKRRAQMNDEAIMDIIQEDVFNAPVFSIAESPSRQPVTMTIPTPTLPPLADAPSSDPSSDPSIVPSLLALTSSEQISNEPSTEPSFEPSIETSTQPSIEPSIGFFVEPSSMEPSSEPSMKSPSVSPSSTPTATTNVTGEIAVTYTSRDSPDWPSTEVWEAGLGALLSPDANLINNMFDDPAVQYQELCEYDGISGFERMHGSQGVCMAAIGCEFQFCNTDGNRISNLPAYTVEAKTSADVSAALVFADQHNIPVSVKLSGHNFHGASMLKDSLNVWMINFEKDGTIHQDYTDSCGNQFPTTLGVNGGELWDDVMRAIGNNYHILAGETRHVGAAGGWLQGVGLSHTARTYGLGVDNVVSFNVVLANGQQVLADACTNPDLFWALRGGGGGTFGVVTHVEYVLHPATRFVYLELDVNRDEPEATRLFLDWFTRVSPDLPKQFGGAWVEPHFMDMYIVEDTENIQYMWDLILEFETFADEVLRPAGFEGWYEFEVFDGFSEFVLSKNAYRSAAWYDWWTGASTRLIPREAVVNDRVNLVDFLTDLYRDEGRWGFYWLGGKVMEYGIDETSVHPVMRSTEYSLSTGTAESNRRVRERFPNDISGSSVNHQSPTEPDWRTANWGPTHYQRLLEIKNRYDPKRRFNCWHCVGFHGPEFEIS